MIQKAYLALDARSKMRPLVFAIKLVLTMALAGQLSAQTYQIVAYPPAPGFGERELFNMMVIRGPIKAHSTYIVRLSVKSKSGVEVLNSETPDFSFTELQFSINKMVLNQLGALRRNYIASELSNFFTKSGGRFPPGTYGLTFSLWGYPVSGGGPEFLAEASIGAESGEIFPAELILPLDGDSLPGLPVNFSWSPAMGLGNIRIQYEFLLVPVFSGQSPDVAIQSNPAHYRKQGISTNGLVYQGGYPPLEKNQWYAWQVICYLGDIPQARSQVWRFILPEQIIKPCEPKEAEIFYRMEIKPNSYFIPIENGQIDIQFNEKYEIQRDALRYEIFNARGKLAADSKTFPAPFRAGYNRFSLILGTFELNLPVGYYTLVVHGEKGEKWQLRFHVKKEGNPCEG